MIEADGSSHLVGITDHNDPSARRLMSAENDLPAFWSSLHDPAYFRFTFVRNPYHRIVSAYLDKIASDRSLTHKKKLLGFASNETVTFLDFLRGISNQSVGAMNRHWRPQSALISPKVKLDFLGRFERFDEDFEAVRERLGVKKAMVHNRRQHKTSASNYLDLIGIEEKALVDRIYRDDFERFGYPRRL